MEFGFNPQVLPGTQHGGAKGMAAAGPAVLSGPQFAGDENFYVLYVPSVLFLILPRSEGWPHNGRTFSIYLYPLSF